VERALEYFAATGAKAVLQVGDIADGYGSIARTLSLLAEHGVLAVRGNHDRWLLAGAMRELPAATDAGALTPAGRDYLASLPPTREFKTPLGPLLLCHGLGENDMAKVKPDDEGYALTSNSELWTLVNEARYRFVVNGHSHRAMVRRFGPLTIVNAGTLLRDDQPCIVVIDFAKQHVEIVPFDAAGRLDTGNVTTLELAVDGG
jgi:predicted phosphodiesterase